MVEGTLVRRQPRSTLGLARVRRQAGDPTRRDVTVGSLMFAAARRGCSAFSRTAWVYTDGLNHTARGRRGIPQPVKLARYCGPKLMSMLYSVETKECGCRSGRACRFTDKGEVCRKR